MPRINTLTTRAFRGVIDEALPFDGRSLVLLGENGTGKSSFVDALEFFFTGRVGHLEGTQGISTTQHAPHIKASRQDASVAIEFAQPSCTLQRSFTVLQKIAPELASYMDLGATSAFILRRKNILDFILAQPAPRYTQLAAIIGVDDLDKSEHALKQARDELEAERDEAARQEQAASLALRQTLGEAAVTDDAILTQLNHKLQELGQTPLITLADIEARKIAAVGHGRSSQDAKRLAEVTNLLALVIELSQANLAPAGYREYASRVKGLRADGEHRQQMLLARLLASSRVLVTDLGLDYCPVCLRPIGKEDLLASLDQRVRQTEELSQKALDISKSGAALASSVQQLAQRIQVLHQGAGELGLSTDRAPLQLVTGLLARTTAALQTDPWDGILAPMDNADASLATDRFRQCLVSLRDELLVEQERLGQTDQDRRVVAVIDLLTKTDENRRALRRAQAQRRTKAAAQREMAAVYECFVATKQREVQAIYTELESDIQKYFQSLHAEEGYRSVKLEINAGRRASTDIRMSFYDRDDQDPRGFNSEGHLDSLGLCIFLAFVKHFNADFPLMVLDDVVSSIDSRHRRHICDLLSEEFSDYQLFITTHDYVWFEELCAHQRASRVQHKFTNLQIVDWTLDGGPRLSKYSSRWERIEEKLANADRDGAAADVRKEFESFLYEICIRLETPVTLRRDGRYTVSDLLDPFVKRVKKLVPDVCSSNLGVFQALHSTGIFGNLLVHNNPLAANTALAEVRGFAEAVRGLENLFTCSEGHMVEYHRTAKVMKCRCGAINWPTQE